MTENKKQDISKRTNIEERHVLSLLLDNEVGALGRVVGLFSSRGYNIDSLTVSEIDPVNKVSRLTIATYAPPHVIKHITALLERLVPVYKIYDLTAFGPHVERGVILVKVKAKGKARNELLHIADQFEAKQIDATDQSFIFELTDIPTKLNEFIEMLSGYGIIELSRTGITAMMRGTATLENSDS